VDEPWSEGLSVERREAARQIFLQGNRLLNMPLYAQAADKYKEALAMWPHPAFYYNLAIAQLNLVQSLAAHASLQKAIEYGAAPLGEREHARALEYLERLRSQLGWVEIVSDEPGARVTLDGRDLFIAPGRYEGVVEPGGHEVVARKPGRIAATEQLVLSPGQRAEVVLRLRIPDRIETARYMPRWVPWASLGAGAMLVGVGGYFDSRSTEELTALDDELARQCPRGCDMSSVPEMDVRFQEAEQDRRAALGLYIGGGLVVAGSAILFYVNRERVVRGAPGQAVGSDVSVRLGPAAVAPMMSRHAMGVTIWSTF
jgi:tetratricopeptide (TPR) repeat protein